MKFWVFLAAVFAVLLLALFPLLWWFKLPPNIRLAEMAALYFGIGTRALLVVLVFFLIQKPGFFRPVFETPARGGLFSLLVGLLWLLNRANMNNFFIVAALSLIGLCLYPRTGNGTRLKGLAWAAIAFFFGLAIVFSYESMASAVVDNSRFDAFFLTIDRFLLFGHSVADFSRVTLSVPGLGLFLQAIYYGLFQVEAAALIWLGLEGDKGDAMNFVCDILSCYLITLVVYSVLPSLGPFFFSASAAPLSSIQVQNASAAYLHDLHRHHELFYAPNSYFIAFPCMHIAQSAVVAWHVRRWRRLLLVLVVFNLVLAIAIVGLEWHYFVDLPGGLLVVWAAIKLRLYVQRKTPNVRPAVAAGSIANAS